MARSIAFLFLFLTLFTSAFSQITAEQRIQHSVIGWDPKNIYDKYVKP